jgi:hypothetical protein
MTRSAPLARLLSAWICAAVAPLAHAELACDAPWMHQGGGFTLTMSPSGQKVDFLVTAFSKQDGQNCGFDVRTTMKIAVPGHDMGSQSDMHVAIAGGHAHTEQRAGSGKLNGHTDGVAFNGLATEQTAGLLSYVGEISGEGQRLAGTRSESSVAGQITAHGQTMSGVSIPKTVTTTSDKQVGTREDLATAVGKFSCWPVGYDRRIQSNTMQMMGRTLNMDTHSHVVDHFCPAAGLVMRKDITTDGRSSSSAITALH